MKRGTPDHPKVADLCEALNLRRPTVLGHLELLWHFAAKFTPEGDVGRYSDKRIAAAMDWAGKPDKLIQSLVATGWLDRDDRVRLVVHDWSDHADRAVMQRLSRNGKQPIKGAVSGLEQGRGTVVAGSGQGCSKVGAGSPQACDGIAPPLEQGSDSVLTKITVQPNHTVTREVCTQSETKNGTLSALARARPEPEPVPEPEPEPVNTHRALLIPTRKSDGKPGDEFFERIYSRHPKKGHRGAAMRVMSEIHGIESAETQRKIDEAHAAWCNTDDWRWKNGAKAPPLDEWLIDRGYDYQPPPPADDSGLDEIGKILMGVKRVG